MKNISIEDLYKKTQSKNNPLIIDVRTPAENRAIKIQASHQNISVESIFDKLDTLPKDIPIYIMCNSGNRSKMVCEDLDMHNIKNLINVEGGIQAWIKAKLPVYRSKKWSMPIIQQVMAIAGTLILSSVLAGQYLRPELAWLSGAVGAGLLYAGLSGNCYMTRVLAVMPWNK